MGITLREIIYDIGGGLSTAGISRRFKTEALPAVVTASALDLPVDYERLAAATPLWAPAV
jgi:NADH:ubiquinone oxidoreductase subunit F (NADH-binding)